MTSSDSERSNNKYKRAGSEQVNQGKRLGDAPIEDTYCKNMKLLATTIDTIFNGPTRGQERKTGFVLLVFPFHDHEGRCNYISNGADRNDIITLFKEQIKRFEGQPEQSGTA